MRWGAALETVASFVRGSRSLPKQGGFRMVRQRSLDFSGEQLAAIWKAVPERCRKHTVALWARLIAAAAQRASKRKGVAR